VTRRRLMRGAAVAGGAALGAAALAPLVDLLTLLLIALLRSHSQDPPVLLPEAALALPRTRAEAATRAGVVTVDIGPDGLWLDGFRLGPASALHRGAGRLDLLYAPLLQRSKGPLVLRADAAVPWSSLERALLTAREAGFVDVELVAERAGSL
jgi:biopolymer transport protein ExbD